MSLDGALGGVKVLDFSWALAGPFTTKLLAEHGAEVIKIETSTRIDFNRRAPPYKDGIPGVDRSAFFAITSNNKYGVSLNLNHPRGVGVARKLVRWSDVVVENFTPGTMSKWGLSYEELTRIKPDIIVASLSLQGQTGPHSRYLGYGMLLQAIAGVQVSCGWPDRTPVGPGPQASDYVGAFSAMIAIMAALEHRDRTGQGQHIDVSQFESFIPLLGVTALEAAVHGREPQRSGNRHRQAAPHGAYRCRGADRWCTLAVFSEEEWDSLRRVMGSPAWTLEPRFAALQGRLADADELDKLVESWTVNYPAEQVMAVMQSSGVAAGVVQDGRDLRNDPQLAYRSHFQDLEHPVIGRHSYEAPAFKLSDTWSQLTTGAPCLGEHNEYVYKTVLGMTDEEFDELLLAGAFE